MRPFRTQQLHSHRRRRPPIPQAVQTNEDRLTTRASEDAEANHQNIALANRNLARANVRPHSGRLWTRNAGEPHDIPRAALLTHTERSVPVYFQPSLVLKSNIVEVHCWAASVKHKAQRNRTQAKPRAEPSRDAAADRFVIPTASSTSVGSEPFGEESEAEMMVTSICDSILDRLNGTEAADDEAKAQRPRRRTR